MISLLGASLLGIPPKETSNGKHEQFGPFLSFAAENGQAAYTAQYQGLCFGFFLN